MSEGPPSFSEWMGQSEPTSVSHVTIASEKDARFFFSHLLPDPTFTCCICLEHIIYPIILDEEDCQCQRPMYCGPCFTVWRDSDYKIRSQYNDETHSYRFIIQYSNIHPHNEIYCCCCRHPMNTYRQHQGNCSVDKFQRSSQCYALFDTMAIHVFPQVRFTYHCLWCNTAYPTIQSLMVHMLGNTRQSSCLSVPVPCQYCGKTLRLYDSMEEDYDKVFWSHVMNDCDAPRCPFPTCHTFSDHLPLTHDTFMWHLYVHTIQQQLSTIPYVQHHHLFDASVSSSAHPGWTIDDLQRFQRLLHEWTQWVHGTRYVQLTSSHPIFSPYTDLRIPPYPPTNSPTSTTDDSAATDDSATQMSDHEEERRPETHQRSGSGHLRRRRRYRGRR